MSKAGEDAHQLKKMLPELRFPKHVRMHPEICSVTLKCNIKITENWCTGNVSLYSKAVN